LRAGRTGGARVALRACRAGIALRALRPYRSHRAGLIPTDRDLRRPAFVAVAGVDHSEVADVLLVAAVDDSARVGDRRERHRATGEERPRNHPEQEPAPTGEPEPAHCEPPFAERRRSRASAVSSPLPGMT